MSRKQRLVLILTIPAVISVIDVGLIPEHPTELSVIAAMWLGFGYWVGYTAP